MTIEKYELKNLSSKFKEILRYINSKYYEVEDFSLCILLSMISKTHMIALGQPGIAKSAILREIVDVIDFSNYEGTPYFQIQMGADISPNNVLGSPDIEYYKKHGIIKRNYTGFLPDAIIAFCSEFYRINDQVANSGILTIMNEGEFKNGTEIVKAKLRFLMADTNFFPKQPDDLDAEDDDLRLQALHDRFLARILVKPLKDKSNKVKMILMDDHISFNSKLDLEEIIYMQELIEKVELPEKIAMHMVDISEKLQIQKEIFISPRRLKNSRNLVKAHALLNNRMYCTIDDLIALKFSFWQKEDDINIVNDIIYDTMNLPLKDAEKYNETFFSITNEIETNIENTKSLPNFDPEKVFIQGLKDLEKLLERISLKYSPVNEYPSVEKVYKAIQDEIKEIAVRKYLV